MPTYEYKCKNCGGVFEKEQRITEEPLQDCILCTSGKVERLVSASSFVLKGSGWYKTDYASGSSSSHSRDLNPKDLNSKSPEKKETTATVPDSVNSTSSVTDTSSAKSSESSTSDAGSTKSTPKTVE